MIEFFFVLKSLVCIIKKILVLKKADLISAVKLFFKETNE